MIVCNVQTVSIYHKTALRSHEKQNYTPLKALSYFCLAYLIETKS